MDRACNLVPNYHMRFFRVCILLEKCTLKWAFTSRPFCMHDYKLTPFVVLSLRSRWWEVYSRESWEVPGCLAVQWICAHWYALQKQICQIHRCFSVCLLVGWWWFFVIFLLLFWDGLKRLIYVTSVTKQSLSSLDDPY